jgi:hypothetical protein
MVDCAPVQRDRHSPSHNVALWTLSCGSVRYYILDDLYVSAEMILYRVFGTTGLYLSTVCCSLPIHPAIPICTQTNDIIFPPHRHESTWKIDNRDTDEDNSSKTVSSENN